MNKDTTPLAAQTSPIVPFVAFSLGGLLTLAVYIAGYQIFNTQQYSAGEKRRPPEAKHSPQPQAAPVRIVNQNALDKPRQIEIIPVSDILGPLTPPDLTPIKAEEEQKRSLELEPAETTELPFTYSPDWALSGDRMNLIACNSRGNRLLVTSVNQTLLLDAKTGKTKETYAFQDPISEVTFNPKGTEFAASTISSTEILNLVGKRSSAPVPFGGSNVRISKNGKYLLIQQSSNSVVVNIASRKVVSNISHEGLITSEFSDDSKNLVTIGSNKIIAYWDIESGQLEKSVALEGDFLPTDAIVIPSRSISILSSFPRNGSFRNTAFMVFDLESGKLLCQKEIRGSNLAMKFSGNGNLMATWQVGHKGNVVILDTSTLDQKGMLQNIEVIDLCLFENENIATITKEVGEISGLIQHKIQTWISNKDHAVLQTP